MATARLTTKDQKFSAMADQRRRLADVLDGFGPSEWDHMSLCAGWRVRDVVGHLISTLEIPAPRFALNVAKARSFHRYADRVALQFGQREPAILAASLRSRADERFALPVIGPIALLTDIVTHTRDIEVPLGIDSTLDVRALATALDFACGGKAIAITPPGHVRGLRFAALDLEWCSGHGPEVNGPADALLLAVTGRRVALDQLRGDGVDVLRRRLS